MIEAQQDLRVELVTSWPELEPRRRQWQGLRSQLPHLTPFSDFEFIALWWKYFRDPGCQLRVLLVLNDDVLVAALPLYRRMTPLRRILPTLHFIGQGEAEHEEICAEYPDILVHPDNQQVAVELLAHRLVALTGWWRFKVKDALADSIFVSVLLPELEQLGVQHKIQVNGIRYWLTLTSQWDGYLASLKHNYRRKINLAQRRCMEQDEAELSTVTDAERIESSMNSLAELHGRRWQAAGEQGAFVSERFHRFHIEWAQDLFGRGLLRLSQFSIAGTPVAAIYQIHTDGTTYYYQSGVDVEKWGALSPGRLMLGHGIKQAIESGDRVYDFMRGADVSYKKDYGCETSEVFRMDIYALGFGGLVAQCIERLKEMAAKYLGRRA